jgi:hypothetical protein
LVILNGSTIGSAIRICSASAFNVDAVVQTIASNIEALSRTYEFVRCSSARCCDRDRLEDDPTTPLIIPRRHEYSHVMAGRRCPRAASTTAAWTVRFRTPLVRPLA